MYINEINNIVFTPTPFPNPIPTPVPTPPPPPYSKYWTRYKNSCPNKNNSYYQLNMKRKALTLQYNNSNHAQLKKTNQYIKAVKNQNRITNRDNHKNQRIISKCSRDISFSAAQSNVPGDKSFILYDNPNIQVYNYIPVKRTYQGGNNKYPYTAWKYGMLGFPRGMKGTSREMRKAAQLELSNNSVKYSRSYPKACYNTLCINQIIKEVSANLLNNNNIENTIRLLDTTNNIKVNIFTSNNNTKNNFSNKNLYPVILNTEYTDIGTQGQIWCSQYTPDVISNSIKKLVRNTYAIASNNIAEDNTINLSYMYFLTVHNNEWWYSISKLTLDSISKIRQYYQSELKTLAYPLFAPYPFIEFKLEEKPDSRTVKNNYIFTVKEIYFQTNKVKTNLDINLNNIPVSEKDYNFTSNRCLQNSGIKLFFTITQDEWKHKYFYRKMYITAKDVQASTKSNDKDISTSQCIGSSILNACRPCNAVYENCGPEATYRTCAAKANSYFDNEYCPKNGVFNALTNTFWWRNEIKRNFYYYPPYKKFKDICNNLTIDASFDYYDYCTTESNLEFIINCKE